MGNQPVTHRYRFLLIASLLLLAGCGAVYRYLSSGPVGWAIKHEVRDNKRQQISVAALTRFPWEELIVFSSYTPTQEICRRLQLDDSACKAADLPEPMNDGLSLIVFRKAGRIVHREIHLGYHGEFRVEERSFSPADAHFVVEAIGTLGNGEPHLVLRWQPVSSPSANSSKQTP